MWFLRSGDLFNGRYRIDELRGAGGMGSVYAARDETLDIPVAVKIIKPELVAEGAEAFIQRFKREVVVARVLMHPNIVRVFEYGETDVGGARLHYFTMELLEGTDLASWSASQEPTLPEILRIVGQLCAALGEAHRQDVIHRDLKPQNVFVETSGNVKLMDFGISRLDSRTALTQGTPKVLGTPLYMSPEQVTAQVVDHRTDIYSLGVVLYELGTGQVPFAGDSLMALAHQHVHETPASPRRLNPSLPERFEEITLRCLAKEPGNRYESIEALQQALGTVDPAQSGNSVRPVNERTPHQTPVELEVPSDAEPQRTDAVRDETTTLLNEVRAADRKRTGILLGGLAAALMVVVLLVFFPSPDEAPSGASVSPADRSSLPEVETARDAPPTRRERAEPAPPSPQDEGEPMAVPASTTAVTPEPPRSVTGYERAQELLRGEDIEGAAAAFLRYFRTEGDGRNAFTIGIGLYCNLDNHRRINAAAQRSGDRDFFVLPARVQGRACYRWLWGTFDSRSEAEEAMSSMPRPIRPGDAAAVPLGSLIR